MESIQCNQIHIFTDGAAKMQNKKNVKTVSSIGVYFYQLPHQNISLLFSDCLNQLRYNNNYTQYFQNEQLAQLEDKETNQRAELAAIIFGLLESQQLNDIIIYSDSLYCINIINQWFDGWIKQKIIKSNWDLIIIMMSLVKKRQFNKQYQQFIHVRGHQNPDKTEDEKLKYLINGNNFADKLANLVFK